MRWTLDSIPWHEFQREKVNPDHLILAKTACVVEYNSADYVTYLKNVFIGDNTVTRTFENWGSEERQHGEALARWVRLADPDFDFQRALARFRAAYQIPVQAQHSVRGSRTAELVARCVVESGTTTYYTGLSQKSEEPVFRAICRQIAQDEMFHFQLFYRLLERYMKWEPLSVWERAKVALSRTMEASDEELLYAYAAACLEGDITEAKLPEYLSNYMGRVMQSYTVDGLRIGIGMAARASGLGEGLGKVIARPALWATKLQAKKYGALAGATFSH